MLNLNALEQNGVRYTVLLKKPLTNSHHQIKLAEEDMDLRIKARLIIPTPVAIKALGPGVA